MAVHIMQSPKSKQVLALICAGALASAGAAPALDASATGESEQDELARRATDPTASPLTFSLIGDFTTDSYRFSNGPEPEDTTLVKLQPVLPFKAWGGSHILRMTLPYQVSGAGANGLGDVSVFDLMILGRSWGRLGVGAVASFSSKATDPPSHTAAGPAVGFVARASSKLNLGLFNQNLFANEISISQFQPIVAFQLGNGWSLSAGDLQIVYDWERDELVSFPIGFQLGKVVRIAEQPMRFAVNPQYDFEIVPGNARFKTLFTVSLLVPN